MPLFWHGKRPGHRLPPRYENRDGESRALRYRNRIADCLLEKKTPKLRFPWCSGGSFGFIKERKRLGTRGDRGESENIRSDWIREITPGSGLSPILMRHHSSNLCTSES